MKKAILFLAGLAVASSIHAQGAFNFNNLGSSGAITIGAFNAGPSEGLAGQFVGTGYAASLYYGPATATQFSQLSNFPIPGIPGFFPIFPVFFGNGVADPDQSSYAGFFDGGNISLPTEGTVEVGVAVWWIGPGPQGAATSYVQALADGYNTGFSAPIPIALSFTDTDPSTIQDLTALQPFTVGVVPEPTTLALCGLSAASLLLFRRKK
jgi:hypothetical protein